MSWKGAFAAGDTIDFKFSTRRFNTGAPFTLAGSPAVSVYKANSTTQSTAGVTLTVDFDSLTGLNHVRVDTTADGTFYANGSQFDVVITAGTVDSVSVVGEVVGRFELRAALATASALATVQADTDDIQTRLPAALVGGRMDTSVGAVANDAITAAAIATDALGALELAAGAASEIATAVRTELATELGRIDAAVSTRASQSSLDTVDDFLDTEVAAIKAVTDKLDDTLEDAGTDGFIFSALALSQAPGDAAVLAAIDALPTATENADALLNRDMSAVSDTNARSPLNALRFLRNKWSLSSTTLTVTKENDSTEAWTAEVTTSPGADPVSGSDPA